jgi:hypothetical protein
MENNKDNQQIQIRAEQRAANQIDQTPKPSQGQTKNIPL